jgi:hypothetical protein
MRILVLKTKHASLTDWGKKKAITPGTTSGAPSRLGLVSGVI